MFLMGTGKLALTLGCCKEDRQPSVITIQTRNAWLDEDVHLHKGAYLIMEIASYFPLVFITK